MRTFRSFGALLVALMFIVVACGSNPGGSGAGGSGTGSSAPSVAGSAAASEEASEAATSEATEEATEPASGEPSDAATSEPTEVASADATPSGSDAGNAADFVACEVSDTGGINDKGFNQNAYKGLTDAQAELGIGEPQFLESTADTDYTRNIQTFIDQGCDIIITVGFLLGTATQEAAEANPEQKFAIVDFAYDPPLENVSGIVFKMDEPSMLAGYLAAGMSNTDTVATFGGIQIPPVVDFMQGFSAGVEYWNSQKGEDVQLLGWDAAAGTGSFTGDFSDTAKGAQLAEGFIQEGADVIFAVAGPVGLGAMAAVQDANEGLGEEEQVRFIGVDVDQVETAPEYSDILVTSVLKRIDNGVKGAIQAALEGTFEGGVQVNTLENEGTGLAPYHEFEEAVPAELTSEIEALQAAIISGEVVPADWYAGAPE